MPVCTELTCTSSTPLASVWCLCTRTQHSAVGQPPRLHIHTCEYMSNILTPVLLILEYINCSTVNVMYFKTFARGDFQFYQSNSLQHFIFSFTQVWVFGTFYHTVDSSVFDHCRKRLLTHSVFPIKFLSLFCTFSQVKSEKQQHKNDFPRSFLCRSWECLVAPLWWPAFLPAIMRYHCLYPLVMSGRSCGGKGLH